MTLENTVALTLCSWTEFFFYVLFVCVTTRVLVAQVTKVDSFANDEFGTMRHICTVLCFGDKNDAFIPSVLNIS